MNWRVMFVLLVAVAGSACAQAPAELKTFLSTNALTPEEYILSKRQDGVVETCQESVGRVNAWDHRPSSLSAVLRSPGPIGQHDKGDDPHRNATSGEHDHEVRRHQFPGYLNP